MIRALRFAAVAAPLLGTALVADAQSAPAASSAITAREIDGHLRFLSHDLLERRAPATRGDVLRIGMLAANAPTAPTWNSDAELRALRALVP